MPKERHTVIPASYLVLEDSGRVLLSRRYNTGYRDGWYSMIAGHVEASETFTQCMIREAYEEAGIVIHSEDVRVAHIMHRKSEYETETERVDVFFLCDRWEWEITNMEPEKCDDLSWFSLDALPENTIPYVRYALAMMQKNIGYSEYGWSD